MAGIENLTCAALSARIVSSSSPLYARYLNKASVIVIGDEVKGLRKLGDNLQFYVNGATFADLHYKINNGGQLNVAMNPIGNGNYTYPVNTLQ